MRTSADHYRALYGCRVYRLSLDGGFTCPNRDGTLSTGGCRFCGPDGGGGFAQGLCPDIREQLEKAKQRVAFKNRSGRYIAYSQSFSGTYAPVERLRALFTRALEPEEILGLSIGTRPDCLPPPVVELLAELNERKPVSVELGLQTAWDETARRMNRGYDLPVYLDAVQRLKQRGIEVVTHIILGLPGETPEMAEHTTRTALAAGTDGLKFHLLHVLKGSALAEDYAAGSFRCLEEAEYADWLIRCLRLVPEKVTVHRITGDGAKKDLIAPLWSADKKRVMNDLRQRLREEGLA